MIKERHRIEVVQAITTITLLLCIGMFYGYGLSNDSLLIVSLMIILIINFAFEYFRYILFKEIDSYIYKSIFIMRGMETSILAVILFFVLEMILQNKISHKILLITLVGGLIINLPMECLIYIKRKRIKLLEEKTV